MTHATAPAREALRAMVDIAVATHGMEWVRDTMLTAPARTVPYDEYLKTREAYYKASGICDEAYAAYRKANAALNYHEAFNEANDAYLKTHRAYYETRAAYHEAHDAYDRACDILGLDQITDELLAQLQVQESKSCLP